MKEIKNSAEEAFVESPTKKLTDQTPAKEVTEQTAVKQQEEQTPIKQAEAPANQDNLEIPVQNKPAQTTGKKQIIVQTPNKLITLSPATASLSPNVIPFSLSGGDKEQTGQEQTLLTNDPNDQLKLSPSTAKQGDQSKNNVTAASPKRNLELIPEQSHENEGTADAEKKSQIGETIQKINELSRIADQISE